MYIPDWFIYGTIAVVIAAPIAGIALLVWVYKKFFSKKD